MSRLISTSDLHNVVMKRKTEYGKLATLVDNIVEDMVSETPTAIRIPEGATNGDMILELLAGQHDKIYPVGNTQMGITLDCEWWNASYQKEVKE